MDVGPLLGAAVSEATEILEAVDVATEDEGFREDDTVVIDMLLELEILAPELEGGALGAVTALAEDAEGARPSPFAALLQQVPL